MTLEQRLRLLRAERDSRVKELAALNDMIATLERHVPEITNPVDIQPKQSATQLAWDILKQNGPLPANYVADMMIQRGYLTNAKRLPVVVYQRMKESPSWFKRRGRVWEAIGDKPPYERPAPGKVKRID